MTPRLSRTPRLSVATARPREPVRPRHPQTAPPPSPAASVVLTRIPQPLSEPCPLTLHHFPSGERYHPPERRRHPSACFPEQRLPPTGSGDPAHARPGVAKARCWQTPGNKMGRHFSGLVSKEIRVTDFQPRGKNVCLFERMHVIQGRSGESAHLVHERIVFKKTVPELLPSGKCLKLPKYSWCPHLHIHTAFSGNAPCALHAQVPSKCSSSRRCLRGRQLPCRAST